MFKGYERDVPCHTARSATPYLFGAEVGPGSDGKYFVGASFPTQWVMQMRTDEYSERSVHAAHRFELAAIDVRRCARRGRCRGRLAADNPDEDGAYRSRSRALRSKGLRPRSQGVVTVVTRGCRRPSRPLPSSEYTPCHPFGHVRIGSRRRCGAHRSAPG